MMRLVLATVLILFSVTDMGCKKYPEETHRSGDAEADLNMTVQFAPTSEILIVRVSNTSSNDIRLWQLKNRWGWFSFEVLIVSDDIGQALTIHRKLREWTKDGPSYDVLERGLYRETFLNLRDAWWEVPPGLKELEDKPLSVQVRYSVHPTPESTEYGVFTGTVVSDPVRSLPPHLWLFDGGRECSLKRETPWSDPKFYV